MERGESGTGEGVKAGEIGRKEEGGWKKKKGESCRVGGNGKICAFL